MANKLEKVLELLVNEDEKQASALLHEWFVENAREIHQKLVEEEDAVLGEDELSDEVAAEEFYEAGEDEEGEEGAMDADDAEFDLSADLEDGEGEAEAGEDSEGEEEGVEGRLEDLEAELEELKSEFEAMMADEDGDGDVDGHMHDDDADAGEEGVDELGDEEGSEEDMEEAEGIYGDPEGEGSHDPMDRIKPGHGDDDGVYETEHEDMDEETDYEDVDSSVELDEDDFADLEESALSMLQAVKNQNAEAHVGAEGKRSLSVNKESPIPQHDVEDRAEGATPLNKKQTEYSHGYNMETPPATKQGTGAKNATNVEKKSKNTLSSVPQGGDSSAMINNTEGAEGNVTSPIAGKKKGKK